MISIESSVAAPARSTSRPSKESRNDNPPDFRVPEQPAVVVVVRAWVHVPVGVNVNAPGVNNINAESKDVSWVIVVPSLIPVLWAAAVFIWIVGFRIGVRVSDASGNIQVTCIANLVVSSLLLLFRVLAWDLDWSPGLKLSAEGWHIFWALMLIAIVLTSSSMFSDPTTCALLYSSASLHALWSLRILYFYWSL
jgi:hypothetical protein